MDGVCKVHLIREVAAKGWGVSKTYRERREQV
jgi:hypothetical protein